jgi:circadian clock protein KaiB
MITDKEGSLVQDNWSSAANSKYSLRLFVAGASAISIRAISNLQLILEEKLKGRYELEIIDIHQQPLLVKEENIFAVPLLIRKIPQPIKRLIGDMSDTAKVLKGLDLT